MDSIRKLVKFYPLILINFLLFPRGALLEQKEVVCTRDYPFKKYTLEPKLTTTEVLDFCGQPESIIEKETNREEIWIYKDKKIFFKNGRLTDQQKAFSRLNLDTTDLPSDLSKQIIKNKTLNNLDQQKNLIKTSNTTSLKTENKYEINNKELNIRDLLNDIAVHESNDDNQSALTPPS